MTSTSKAPPSKPSTDCTAPRVLRCFCNCSELTRDEIESLINRSVDELLANAKGRRIFQAFLQLGHTTAQSGAMRRLLCFEMCERIIESVAAGGGFPPADDDVCDLQEMCPSFQWEQRLDETLDRGDAAAFVEFCTELQYQSKLDLEQHTDFQRFRVALRNKLKQNP